jgi:hypothetical protein
MIFVSLLHCKQKKIMMGTKILNKVQDDHHLELIVNIEQWVITFVHISCVNFLPIVVCIW